MRMTYDFVLVITKDLKVLTLDIFSWLMYALYSRSERGHLFHFCRLVSVMLPDTPDTDRKEKNNAIIKEHANTEEIEAMVKKYEDRLDV